MTEYDIKTMTEDQLELLAVDLRDKLITNISKTGGHLASNLGVVELTLALHKVFDTSKDKVIWDVGHQSYVHKLLTGREEEFSTLRQLDGISGFPKRNESIHDVFDTGHSSNSISVAAGMAAARDLKKEDYDVVAVIGDGSLTGGEAFEGLNNLGDLKSKAIVILNDNGMSIRANTGGISNHLSKLRVSKRYYNFKGGVKKVVKKIPGIGNGLYQGASKMRDIVKYAIVEGVYFEELGFTYIGPIDGHDIETLVETLEGAKAAERSCVIHVITKKGKGYKNAERNPGVFHGTGPFDSTTGKPEKSSDEKSFSDIFGIKMIDIAEKNPDVVAISAAMIDGVGLEHFGRLYPKRLFDVGIAEQHAVSFAAGFAACGTRPVVALYSTFLQRAYDQIIMEVCLQNLPVIFAIDRAGVVGADGETHQGVFDLSYLSHMPNMKVLAPIDGKDLAEMMDYALTLDCPVAIRYPRGTAEDLPGVKRQVGSDILRFGRGDDVHIWAAGTMVKNALAAAEILKGKGLKCSVINPGMVSPIDEKAVLDSAAKAKLQVSLEDNVTIGGFGSLLSRHAEVLTLGWPQQFIEHGSIKELHARYGLDGQGIAERIGEAIEGKA